MRRSWIVRTWMFLVAAGLALSPLTAWAAEQEGWGEGGRIYAVQKKGTRYKHELHGAVGVLPMDAFYKGVAFGAGYTYRFSNHFGWEVLQGLFSANIDTGLKGNLQDIFNVEPTAFREVKLLVNSNLVFVPIYGKVSWMNRKVIRMECFVTGGPGIAQYKSYRRVGASGYSEKSDIYFSANFGIGLRLFMNKRLSVRLDLRDYMNFVDGVDNAAYFGLALGWNFRMPTFSDSEEDDV